MRTRILQQKIARYKAWQTLGDQAPVHLVLKLKQGLPYLQAALVREQAGCGTECADCNSQIPQKRLELVPGAIRCRDCQQEFERSK